MPYAPTRANKAVTLAIPSVTLEAARPWVKVGMTLYLWGHVKVDGVPSPGRRVEIYALSPPSPEFLIGSATTNQDGYYEVGWIVPSHLNGYLLPCSACYFRAYVPDFNIEYGWILVYVAYDTRIADFTVPTTAAVNSPFTVSGYLEYELKGSWFRGVPAVSLTIYYNGTVLGRVTTAANGRFAKTDCIIPKTGTFTITVDFVGTVPST